MVHLLQKGDGNNASAAKKHCQWTIVYMLLEILKFIARRLWQWATVHLLLESFCYGQWYICNEKALAMLHLLLEGADKNT